MVSQGELRAKHNREIRVSAPHLEDIFDAHCHFQLAQGEASQRSARELIARLGGVALMSTEPSNWEAVSALAESSPRARCMFGVHPWFAHKYEPQGEWLERLRRAVLDTPQSAIGEIGLDKRWRPPELGYVCYEQQKEVFIAQLNLASELSVPISVHCVGAQGDLQAILATSPLLPPAIYLHAFGGARGTVEQLVRSKRYGERLYFGFASCVNLRSSKWREAISAVPERRLLVESDRSDAQNSPIAQELTEMLTLFAEVKGWSGGALEATLRTAQNARDFYAHADR